MKHYIPVPPFTFNKIYDGVKRVDVRLFDKTTQRIRLNDSIVYVDKNSNEEVECLVKGIAMFENFEELTAHIPCHLIGYSNSEEIAVRLNRMYPDKFRLSFFACALFIDRIVDRANERHGKENADYSDRIYDDEERVRMKKASQPSKRMTFDEERLLYGMHNYQRD